MEQHRGGGCDQGAVSTRAGGLPRDLPTPTPPGILCVISRLSHIPPGCVPPSLHRDTSSSAVVRVALRRASVTAGMEDPPCKRPRTSPDASVRTPPVACDVALTGGGSDGSGSEGVPVVQPAGAADNTSPGQQPRPALPLYVPVRTHTGFENALRRGAAPVASDTRFVQSAHLIIPSFSHPSPPRLTPLCRRLFVGHPGRVQPVSEQLCVLHVSFRLLCGPGRDDRRRRHAAWHGSLHPPLRSPPSACRPSVRPVGEAAVAVLERRRSAS